MALAEIDRRLMAAALRLGRRTRGQTWPNPAVGALIVRWDGARPIVISRGWTASGGRPHAETQALKQAGRQAHGADCYVTLEPCSHTGKTGPCADALIESGIRRCVVAVADPDQRVSGRGIRRMREAGIQVEVGCLEGDAHDDHLGHITRITKGRPATTLKLAISKDGFAGRYDQGNAPITGAAAKARTFRMRSTYDAILVGVGTVLADDPSLTCRISGLEGTSPVRVIADTNLRTPISSGLARGASASDVWVLAGKKANNEKAGSLEDLGVRILPCSEGPDGRLDLTDALNKLADCGITTLMVEGGPSLAQSLLEADLIDRVAIYRSNVIIGSGQGVLALPGSADKLLSDASRFLTTDVEIVGGDRLVHMRRRR